MFIFNGYLLNADYDFGDAKNVFMWNELDAVFYSDKHRESSAREISKGKRCKEENSTSARMLSRKKISEYFYMPISQAARQLNVGLTHLKKRCRDLGIQRWPHRKLMSLQTLIKNVQVSSNFFYLVICILCSFGQYSKIRRKEKKDDYGNPQNV